MMSLQPHIDQNLISYVPLVWLLQDFLREKHLAKVNQESVTVTVIDLLATCASCDGFTDHGLQACLLAFTQLMTVISEAVIFQNRRVVFDVYSPACTVLARWYLATTNV